MTEPEYLTATEAAAKIRMKPDYVRRMCNAKRIKAIKLGNQWRILPAALDEFMAGEPPPPTRERVTLTARQRRRSA